MGKSCPHPPGTCVSNHGFCKGFSVSRDGKSCPRPPGKCLDAEELYLGQCYKKCSLLTNNTAPNRISAFTCCSTTGLACLSPSNSQTSHNFASSGGKGDQDSGTPSTVHSPLTDLTESSSTQQQPIYG